MRSLPLLISFSLVVSLLLLTGCWDRREPKELGLVVAVGVDRAAEPGKIQVTVQVLKPGIVATTGGDGGGGRPVSPVWLTSATGYDLFDAIRNLPMQSPKQLYWAHNMVWVFGEELARQGLAPIVDLLIRDHELRLQTWVMIAKGSTAAKVLETIQGLETVPATALDKMIALRSKDSTASGVKLQEFVSMLAENGREAVAGRVELFGTALGDQQGSQGSGMQQQRMRVTGTAVFKGDRLIGWLNQPETRGLLWVLGESKSGSIMVKCPGQAARTVALEMEKAKSRVKVSLKDGLPVFTIAINSLANLAEEDCLLQLEGEDPYLALERRQAEAIKNEVEAVLAKAQGEWQTDIFGFGRALERQYPKFWAEVKERWKEEFARANVSIEVQAVIKLQGLLRQPLLVQ